MFYVSDKHQILSRSTQRGATVTVPGVPNIFHCQNQNSTASCGSHNQRYYKQVNAAFCGHHRFKMFFHKTLSICSPSPLTFLSQAIRVIQHKYYSNTWIKLIDNSTLQSPCHLMIWCTWGDKDADTRLPFFVTRWVLRNTAMGGGDGEKVGRVPVRAHQKYVKK